MAKRGGINASNLNRSFEEREESAATAIQGNRTDAGGTELSVLQQAAPLSDSEEAWVRWVNSARGVAAMAYIVWGQRITEVHRQHLSEGLCWGRRWDEWCKERLGITAEYARQLMLIAENITSDTCDVLPPSQGKLLLLAQAEAAKPGLIQQAIAENRIHPDMALSEVRSLKAEAQEVVDVSATPVVSGRKSVSLPVELADRLKRVAKERKLKPSELLAQVVDDWLERNDGVIDV